MTANADWKAMYQPSAEQAEKDRQAAYAAGVPHGELISHCCCNFGGATKHMPQVPSYNAQHAYSQARLSFPALTLVLQAMYHQETSIRICLQSILRSSVTW